MEKLKNFHSLKSGFFDFPFSRKVADLRISSFSPLFGKARFPALFFAFALLPGSEIGKQIRSDLPDCLGESGVAPYLRFHLPGGVHDGGMVASIEQLSDFIQ